MNRRASLTIGVAAALCSCVACARTPGDVAASGAPAPMIVSVGPLPGPGSDERGQTNPFANDRAAAGAGRRLFRQFNCSGCHGEHGGGGMGPSLRDYDWRYGREDARIFGSIAEGRADGMPSWHRMLEEDQIWRLVAYISSMRTRNEPEPPTE